MGQFSRDVLTVSSQVFSRAAAGQDSILSGNNPVNYNAPNPFRLWVIQVVIMVLMTHALGFVLGKIRQPLVISEIIAGIILGPTVMGRIPHFQQRIFPSDSIPLLSLTSTIGLTFYLFLVALELDVTMIKQNAAASVSVSAAGIVLPVGLGAALGVGIYHEFVDPSINLGYFALFVGVAVGITAFPVLCRILAALKLFDTDVGVVALSAGLGNDIVGWILLALTVTFLNASSGLTALWILLCFMGYVFFFLYPIRWAYVWLARRTGSIERGSPTTVTMTVTLLLVLVSVFFTDVIGIHAVFGGFLAGLIIPRENGFTISVVKGLSVIVSSIFMPIYFVLSGLRTDLSLLNNGVTWGYTVLICVVSFLSKFIACGAVALIGGFDWREASAIGTLMSCKGLAELIALNLGLSAGVLDTHTFSMFIFHAIIITLVTTPLVLLFYPERVRVHNSSEVFQESRDSSSDDGFKSKISLVLDKIDQLPAAMMLSQLINNSRLTQTTTPAESTDEKAGAHKLSDLTSSPRTSPPYCSPPTHIDVLRLIELTTRTSAISQKADSLLHSDPVVLTLHTFGILNKLDVSASLSVVEYAEYPNAVAGRAQESGSQLVILPWSRGGSASVHESDSQTSVLNPFDSVLYKSNVRTQDQINSNVYSEFIKGVFSKSPSDVALFVDCGFSGGLRSAVHHLFLPFFGGTDDRLALTFLVQLCHNPMVTAKAARVTRPEGLSSISTIEGAKEAAAEDITVRRTPTTTDTTNGNQTTQTRLASDTADNILWDKYTTASETRDVALNAALSRISFEVKTSTTPLRTAVDLSSTVLTQNPKKMATILLGRSRRMAVKSHQAELEQILNEADGSVGSSVPETLGNVGAAVVAKGIHANLLVMQATVTSPS